MNLEFLLVQKATDLEWSVDIDGKCWEFEKYSPAGEDFCFALHGEDIIDELQKYYDSFDPEEHIIDLLIAKRNGFPGVPDVKTLCDDADAIDNMIYELLQAFIEVEDKYLDEKENVA